MAILAGEVLTAARLLNDSASTTLTQTETGDQDEWTDWGTEFLVFPDPGVEIVVISVLSGYIIRDATPAHQVRVRVAISFDGGSTYAVGNDPNTSVGDEAGAAVRQNVTAQHHRTGTPTGDVIVRAQLLDATDDGGAEGVAGDLSAWVTAT